MIERNKALMLIAKTGLAFSLAACAGQPDRSATDALSKSGPTVAASGRVVPNPEVAAPAPNIPATVQASVEGTVTAITGGVQTQVSRATTTSGPSGRPENTPVATQPSGGKDGGASGKTTVFTPESAPIDIELTRGQAVRIAEDCLPAVIKGDIEVSENISVRRIRTYDNSGKTGEITIFEGKAEVFAPFGGNLTCRISPQLRQDFLDHNIDLMVKQGCEGGCSQGVRQWIWDGRDLRVLAPHTKSAGQSSPQPEKAPSPTAGGMVAPIEAPKSVSTGPQVSDECAFVDHQMNPGEIFSAPKNSMIKGDVFVEGVRYFDDNARTGLIIQLHEDADVTAPFGANVTCVGSDPITMERIIGQAVEEMEASGCGSSCNRVDVVKVPGDRPQGR